MIGRFCHHPMKKILHVTFCTNILKFTSTCLRYPMSKALCVVSQPLQKWRGLLCCCMKIMSGSFMWRCYDNQIRIPPLCNTHTAIKRTMIKYFNHNPLIKKYYVMPLNMHAGQTFVFFSTSYWKLREKYPDVNFSLTVSSALHSRPPTCPLCVI